MPQLRAFTTSCAAYSISDPWLGTFDYGDEWAWEEDFKTQSQGGTDYMYADAVDLVYFAGRGEIYLGGYPVRICFNNEHDDYYLYPWEAAWGDQDLEWIFIEACWVLYHDGPPGCRRKSEIDWAQALQGAHLICGAANAITDRIHGGDVAN